ncbi:hypothetical protein ACP4OV_017031 [Aristida adscensionis]
MSVLVTKSSMDTLQKSNVVWLKRKLVDDCLAKDSKSRRVEVGDVSLYVESRSSSEPHEHRCCIQSNLANDCINYLRSTIPCRVVFYKEGSWCNFPEQIVPLLVDAFKADKSSVVVVMDDQPLLVDFLSMTMVNLRTRKQRSVAWLDGAGKWFYPSALFDEEANEYRKLEMSIFEDTAGGMTVGKVAESPSEAVKKVVAETSPPPHIPCTIDILRKRIVPVERGSGSFVFVQNLFLSGMGPFAMPNSILRIHRYLPKDITAQSRLEAFERQMRLTTEKRGAANARYGWLGCKKQDVVGILTNGFVSIGKKTGNADIYLSPENRAFTSVSLCDVDEKGIQYMILCRAILGNMGTIKPGSEEDFPSTEIHDSGVDNCSNPSYYLIWNSHLSTHICFEYLISFKLAPKVQEYLGQKGLCFHPPPKEGIGDLSALQPIMCKSDGGPVSPWISFKVLFETIQGSISPIARELLFLHYEELRENKITRKEMVKKMVIIVGEKLLVDSLKKLHCSASLWFKPSAKVATDTTNTRVGSMCINTRGNAPSAALAHESLAPNAVLERCELIDSTCGGSQQVSMAFIPHDSSIASMSSQDSLEHCSDGRDPFMPIVVPTVQTSVLREVPENFAFLKTNNCSSFGLRMESNSNALLTQTSYSVRHNPLVPIPQFGISESVSRKGLGSVAPSMPSPGVPANNHSTCELIMSRC